MNDMTVVLQVLVEVNLHAVAVAAQVVTRQVHQHYVLSILFRVVAQILSPLSVGVGITRPPCSSGNRIDVCLTTVDATMCFRT